MTKKSRGSVLDPNVGKPARVEIDFLFGKFVDRYIVKKKRDRWKFLARDDDHLRANIGKIHNDLEFPTNDQEEKIRSIAVIGERGWDFRGMMFDETWGWMNCNSFEAIRARECRFVIFLGHDGAVIINGYEFGWLHVGHV